MRESSLKPEVDPRQEFAQLNVAWQSEHHYKAPVYFVYADDSLSAQAALKWMRQGVAIIWQGDYHQAKQVLAAMSRQIDKPKKRKGEPESWQDRFNLYRLAQAQKAQILNLFLLRINYTEPEGLQVMARRAPDIVQAVSAAGWQWQEDICVSLRELLGVIGAWEWRKKGIWLDALQARIYPYYGVFAPVRGEYVELMLKAPLPQPCKRAFDVGSGTGILSAILARRGVEHIIATDNSPRAVACSQYNLAQLGLSDQVEVLEQAFLPPGQADLMVCNPPWLPSKSSSSLEAAVYDPNSQMLKGFLQGASQQLAPHGQAWLIISDLAEYLGLRSREELLQWIADAGLRVVERYDTRPVHRKVFDMEDPLSQARASEETSLWVLALQ